MTNTRRARTLFALIILILISWAALPLVFGVAQPVPGVALAAPSPNRLGGGAASAFPAGFMLAQSDTGLANVRDGLVSLAAILVALNVVLGRVAKREVSGKVGKEPEFVTREEFIKLERTVVRIGEKMDQERGSILSAAKEDAIHVHERIDTILEQVSSLRGEMKQVSEIREDIREINKILIEGKRA